MIPEYENVVANPRDPFTNVYNVHLKCLIMQAIPGFTPTTIDFWKTLRTQLGQHRQWLKGDWHRTKWQNEHV